MYFKIKKNSEAGKLIQTVMDDRLKNIEEKSDIAKELSDLDNPETLSISNSFKIAAIEFRNIPDNWKVVDKNYPSFAAPRRGKKWQKKNKEIWQLIDGVTIPSIDQLNKALNWKPITITRKGGLAFLRALGVKTTADFFIYEVPSEAYDKYSPPDDAIEITGTEFKELESKEHAH
jgi:hypothetical protein